MSSPLDLLYIPFLSLILGSLVNGNFQQLHVLLQSLLILHIPSRASQRFPLSLFEHICDVLRYHLVRVAESAILAFDL